MFYCIRWQTIFTGHQGIDNTAWPKELIGKICAGMDKANGGLIVHWAETHEYHRRQGAVMPMPLEQFPPPASARWN